LPCAKKYGTYADQYKGLFILRLKKYEKPVIKYLLCFTRK